MFFNITFTKERDSDEQDLTELRRHLTVPAQVVVFHVRSQAPCL